MHKPIPLLNVYAQNEPLLAELMEAIGSVVKSSAFILGPEVKAFEEDFQRYTKVKHAVSCASGSDALLLPLMCMGIGPGDEVIVPSFTFYATAGAVARLGATPVFADSDESYNISLDDLAKKITPRTKAIIPVHLFGQMVDIPALQKVLRDQSKSNQKIYILEDCAQSIGAELNGRQSGTLGDYGAFSFYPTKNLGAMGDAGMLSTSHDDCNERLKMLRVHGSKQRYYHELIGVNSRLDSIQAAVLRVKLRHLAEYEKKRSALADAYTKYFKQTSLEENILIPKVLPGRKHVWNQYTIRARKRDELRKHLADRNIGSEIYYPLAMHKQEAFMGKNKAISLPLCEALEKEVLSLPIFPEMDVALVEQVVAAIDDFYTNY